MIDISKLAHEVFSVHKTGNPIVLRDALLSAVGFDGLNEALRRRWLEPDAQSGNLVLAQNQTHIEEMRLMAEAYAATTPQAAGGLNIGDEVLVVDGGKQYVGAVEKKNQAGAYSISFKGEKPSTRREYNGDEVRSIKKYDPAKDARLR